MTSPTWRYTSPSLTRGLKQRLRRNKCLCSREYPEPSASSTLNFGVQSFHFRSGVVDFELPVDATLLGVSLVGPDPNLGLEQRQFADASVGQTLTAQTT